MEAGIRLDSQVEVRREVGEVCYVSSPTHALFGLECEIIARYRINGGVAIQIKTSRGVGFVFDDASLSYEKPVT